MVLKCNLINDIHDSYVKANYFFFLMQSGIELQEGEIDTKGRPITGNT